MRVAAPKGKQREEEIPMDSEKHAGCVESQTGLSRRELLKRLAAIGLGASALTLVRTSATAASPSFLDEREFVGGLEKLIERTRSRHLVEYRTFKLSGPDLPWKELGMDVRSGDNVTFLLGGRLWLSREADLWVEPGVAFHVRSGGRKPMYNPMLNHGTMIAANAGPLQIARSLAEWENEDGVLWTPPEYYTKTDVAIYGVALKWKKDAAAGLRSLLEKGDVGGAVRRELDRVTTAAPLPAGWDNHFNTGGGDVIFREGGPGQITCHAHKTGGLLRHPAPMPLAPDTRLSWRWTVEELPSLMPENELIGHDYLSVGVEFDDGQDLTYLWSRQLPVGQAFRCPIPRWTPIETHMVIRTGTQELGTWVREERDVYADYQAHVKGDAKNIVRVWLLAVAVFQRRAGICRYEDIRLEGPSKKLKIL
jgi:hypothetical protein